MNRPRGFPAVRIVRDSVKGWRVVCDVHGELARYRYFWPASRDADQHRETCEEETRAELPEGGSRRSATGVNVPATVNDKSMPDNVGEPQ